MKKDKTEIVLVVDNSGSMASICNDMNGGLKTYLESQKSGNGECTVTYYKFSGKTERVFENVPVANVGDVSIKPSGGTALLDAVGTAINEVGNRLSKTPEKQRPELIIFQIITDGEENSSKEFSKAKIRDMVKHQEDKYNWQFLFLGTNFDAFQEGQNYGFQGGKSMSYGHDGQAINATFSVLSDTTSKMRLTANKADLADYSFTEQERRKVK